jgi:hypothetical protein
MKRTLVISRYGMGDGDPQLSISLLEKYLSCSLENKDIKDYYIFYNRGVCAALENKSIYGLLEQIHHEGAEIYFCGACLEFYGLGAEVNIGKICCMNDIRITLNETKADFL